jgi:ribosomal protein S18 acetylase RimI-like enzyme
VWISPDVRGLGVGRRLMGELEARAAAHGPLARLDTNGALGEAVAMYRASGWTEIDAYNDNPYAHHWFEKRLPG